MKKITAYTHIGDYGQAVDNFRFMADNEVKTDEVSLTLEGNYCDMSGRILSKGVTAVSAEDGVVTVEVDPFLYRYDFRICGKIGGEEICLTKDGVDEVIVKDLDTFAPVEENGVHYRLYSPEAADKKAAGALPARRRRVRRGQCAPAYRNARGAPAGTDLAGDVCDGATGRGRLPYDGREF